ncbi:hypothetical protein SUGI_0994920 [Cryptomeria japonica]|uniref:phytochrome A-associated F-box protein n=1 Tax=Cryptomeria japonica TaxID=3369 RepID=UPI0024147A61|nr:phytochrome A-associated F-box protein [Cryptomeria japonica]GLJ47121.1 hypothetical protein SUGI_0994920 [Cryptomeria japonica]
MEEHLKEEVAAFTAISEDILLNIFSKLEGDPRYLANLACVCTKFSSIIRTICWKKKCIVEIPSVVADLLQTPRSAVKLAEPPGGWAALQKLAVCCPGLWHAGVLLDSWDYGLERDIGPSEHYKIETRPVQKSSSDEGTSEIHSHWTAFDDLHFHTDFQAGLGFAQNPSKEEASQIKAEEAPVGENGHGVGAEHLGFEQYPQGKSATADKSGVASVECSSGRKSSGLSTDGRSGYDTREEPREFQQYPHGESCGSANSDPLSAENRNVGQVSSLVTEQSDGENEHGPREEKCGFEQYPPGESAHAVRSGSGCEKPSEGHFSSEMLNSSESSELEAKRKDSPYFLSDECCGMNFDAKKRKKGHQHQSIWPHMATGAWNLSREQGNKLLQSRFRGDCLYICDLPGCIHSEEKRSYRLFRGIFKNFKNSSVWRNIKDMKAKKSEMSCAFCNSDGTWDMLTTFCLRKSFEYHDDGEPVVRAYVCENGHVAGAWTDRPMYT